MSRRSTRTITTMLRQTKPNASSITKKIKKEFTIPVKAEELIAHLPPAEETEETQQHITLPRLKEEAIEPSELSQLAKSSDQELSTSSESGLNLQDAVNHLCAVDSRFRPLFARFIPKPWTAEGLAEPKNHFRSLVLGVISQQVSGAAARSIGRKFVSLFMTTDQPGTGINVDLDPEVEDGPDAVKNDEAKSTLPANAAPAQDSVIATFFPSPEQVAAAEVLYLKSAGLSLRKAEYVQGIAQAFLNKEFTDEFFATADDETIKKKLVSLRGLGPWSAEMFMMFSLNHWDILSPGDIGIQRGMSYFVGKDPKNKSQHHKNKAQKYMSEAEMLAATDAWRPYRSIGCWMMWRIESLATLEPPFKQEDCTLEAE